MKIKNAVTYSLLASIALVAWAPEALAAPPKKAVAKKVTVGELLRRAKGDLLHQKQ